MDTRKLIESYKNSKTTVPQINSPSKVNSRTILKGFESGLITPTTKLSGNDINKWNKQVETISNKAYNYLSNTGYKKADPELLKSIEDLLAQSDDVRQYILYNRPRINDYQTVYDGFRTTEDYLKKLRDKVRDSNDYFSTFPDAKTYEESAKYLDTMQNTDTTKLAEEIKGLEAQSAMADEAIGTMEKLWVGATREDGGISENYRETSMFNTIYNEMLEQGHSEKEAYRLAEEEFQTRYAELNSKKGQGLAGYKTLDELNADISSKKKTLKEVTNYQEVMKLSKAAEDSTDFNKFSLKGAKTKEATDENGKKHKNKLLEAKENNESFFYVGGGMDYGQSKFTYKLFTEDEKKVYNYYFGKGDFETADRYWKVMKKSLNERYGKAIFNSIEGTPAEYLYFVPAGLDQFTTGIKNVFNFSDEYVPASSIAVGSSLVREDLGKKHGTLGTTLYDIGTTTVNMIPSIATGAAVGAAVGTVNPVLGAKIGAATTATLMGASAKGNAYVEKINAGWSVAEAQKYSTIVGVSEACLQYALGGISVGAGALTKHVTQNALNGIKNGFLKGLAKLGISMGSEAIEEGLQEILDPFYENFALGYAENGIEDIDWEQVAYNAVLGGLSGALFEGGGTAANTVKLNMQYGRVYSPYAQEVVDGAREATKGGDGLVIVKKAQETLDGGKKLSGNTLRKLIVATNEGIAQSNVAKLSPVVSEQLMAHGEQGDVAAMADIISRASQGLETESSELKAIENSHAARTVFADIVKNESWVKDLGLQKASDLSYNQKIYGNKNTLTKAADMETSAEGQTVPAAEGIASEGAEAVATETEAATDSIAHPAPTAGKVLKMTPVSAKAKNYVKDIAKRLGTNLEFVDIAAELAKRGQNIEGLVIYPEGFYDPETHTLYVGNEVSNPVEFVFKHELTHYGERSKYYADFARAVRDSKAFKKWLDTQATYTTKDTAGKELQLHLILKERYKGVKNLTEPEAQREVIANFVADVLFKGDVETLSEILNEATPTQKNAVMRFLSDFFSWIKSKFTGSKQIVSEIADLENMFRELIGDAAVNPMPTESGITYDTATEFDSEMSVPEVQTDSSGKKLSKGQRNYFALSKVRDQYGRLLILYHGTANGKFYIFDRSKGNIENDFGRAHYFTTSRSDVAKNYEGGGPDFDAKVRRRAQELMNENGSLTFEQAEQKAHNELFKGSNMHTVYLLMVNPAVVGETNLLDPRIYLEQNNNDYAAAREQAEKDISKIALDLKYKLKIGNVNEITDLLWKVTNQGGIGIEQLKTEIGRLRLRDNDGNRLGNEVTRQIIESLGYDGIIDSTVSGKWNMDMEAGTTHYIVFNSEQIKSVDNKNPTKDTDVRYSVPASEGAVNEKTTEEVGVELDEKTKSVSPLSFSLASWERSDYVTNRDKASAELAEALDISNKKAKAYIDSINGIAKVIADSRIRLDYVSSKGRSSFVSNAEYGGSIDFSTLCKKRRILTGTFSAIQKALRHSALTAEEILDIRNRLKEKGLEVSCGLCYVEGSRAQMGKFSKEFIERYKKRNPEYVPDMFDVNTPEGVEQLRIDHPEVYEAYEQFWNNKGVLNPGDSVLFASQQKPKLYQMRTEYNNEILEKFKNDDNVNEKNKNGGLRLQSFSDFEIVHLIDTMQVILDMSKVGLAGQAYTKVADFALALGNTGLKINLSLIAKDVDANGKLVFDDVEGMPIDTAMRIRDMYSDNVGTILVIFNDAQLKAALADNRVDFIIPFHRSQWKKALYEKLGLPKGTKDYTYQQNERYIKPVYYTTRNGTLGKRKATNYMPNDYWKFGKSGKENAEDYLKMCAKENKRPKFYKLLVDNKDGSYSLQPDGSTDGYWKLLIDFKMYNNEGVGVPQQPVKPDFNMEESMRMLEEYKGGHQQFPVDQETVDEFVSEYREKHKMDDFTEQKAEPKSVETVYDHLSFSVPASEGKAVTPKSLFDKVQKGEISYEEFVKLVNEGWSEAGKTYGVKPDGEMVTANNKPANVPNKVAPGKTVRRFVRNVLEANYSKDFNNALKSETLAKNKGTVYEVQSNKDLAKRARDKISRMSIGRAQENWLKDTDRINPEKIAIGESLLVMAEQEGRIEDGVQLASELAIMFTTAGQVVQAARLFKRLGSIGKLIYLQKMVNKLNRDIARRYKNADPLVLNETLAAQLLETKTEEEAEVVLDAIKAELGQQMPSNFLDKWNAWRYMSMLVNPTTHIRNFTGNLLFKPAIAMSEALSATIQSGVSAVQRARGKEFEKTTTFKANKRDKDFAAKDWTKNRKKVMSSGKYEDVSEIEDNRIIYKNRVLEGVRKGNSNLLEWEDGIFLKNHYIRTLARYLTANKINPETASEAQLDRARKYAIKKAQEYTYRDASKVANWLSKTAKDFKGADFLINGIIPFKKTPINVLKRGIEYSPLGFIKSLVDYGTKVRKGDMTVGEFIDGLASATTGTGLFIIGALLSNLGVLKGDFDDEDKWFEKLRGHQEYSIELFGVSYTINWAAPSSVPMFMGAAFSSFQSDEDGNWFDNLLSMGISGLEPVLELTMLQGVNDALDAVSYAEDNEKLWTLGGNILTSYATQGIPTIGGKIANVIDDKRRTKYIDPSKGSVTLQTMWDTFSKKVPFLSMTRAEYIDAWGREEHTGNVVERFFSQFVSPGYASTIDPDPIYDELKAIKESTGEAGVYPEAPRKYITVGGDRRDLTKEEYYNVATMSGQTKMNLVNEAMDHKFYDKLTDEQKADVIMNIYKYSNKLAVVSELDFTLDEVKAGLGDKGDVLTESRWNGFNFEQQQYLTHEAFMDGVITAYKYEQNGGSAAEYFILKALKNN